MNREAGWVALMVLVGCGDDPTAVPAPSPPVLDAVAATTRPENVLSALATGHARFADSVAVRFGISGTALDSITPAMPAGNSDVTVPVFGLLPEMTYQLRLVGYGDGGTRRERAPHHHDRVAAG